MIKLTQTILPCALVLSMLLSQTYAETFDDKLTRNQSIALNFHDVREDVLKRDDSDQYSINSRNLADFFDWLSHSKWQPVSLQQIIDAREGKKPLPPNAILLSFDDGLLSSYTQVFPLLKQYKLPVVFGIVTGWTNGTNKSGEIAYGKNNFMTWDQMREMQKSGLVTFVSHSDGLHQGILANPQGNQEPAAITRLYLKDQKRYETDQEYTQRIFNDLKKSKEILEKELGHKVEAVIWPYGAVTPETEQIAKQAGYKISFSLGKPGINNLQDGTFKRILLVNNPDGESLQQELLAVVHYHEDLELAINHSISVKLDELVKSSDQEENDRFSLMLNRIQALAVNQIFVDTFDQKGDKVFFPNTLFPVHKDIMNRFTWQVQTRLFADVYANIPLNSFESQPQKLNTFVADLMKNNTSISGIVFNSDHDFLNFMTPEKMKWLDQIKRTASYYSNVSKTFKMGFGISLSPDSIRSLSSNLPNLMNHFDFVNLVLENPNNKSQVQALKKVLANLSPATKKRISLSVNVDQLKSEADWKIAQKTLIEMQELGIQNIGANQYNLDNGMLFHKYLYTPLSQNESPLNYKDPFKKDMSLEKSP